MNPSLDYAEKIVKYIAKLIDNKDLGPLAAIRRGLAKDPGEDLTPYRYIGQYLDGCTENQDFWAYRIAALFAWHQDSLPLGPVSRTVGDFGSSFRRLANTVDSDSIDRRFLALLNAHDADLPEHLRHAVGLLKTRSITVDWVQLLHDVVRWHSDHRDVQRGWAMSYWRGVDPRTRGITPTDMTEEVNS